MKYIAWDLQGPDVDGPVPLVPQNVRDRMKVALEPKSAQAVDGSAKQ